MRHLLTLCVLYLAGCSTMPLQTCNVDQWRDHGASTAMSGGQLDDNEPVYACSNSAPIAYRMGFEYGLEKLCSYEQGLFEGEHGDEPLPNCRDSKWQRYHHGFLTGREIYAGHQRLELITTELRLTRKQLSDVPSSSSKDVLAAVDHERVMMLRGRIANLVSERDFETRRLTSLRQSLKVNYKDGLSSLRLLE
ncbi:MAG: DUF2799 domain-containing protein [Pseudomonadota bacterium]